MLVPRCQQKEAHLPAAKVYAVPSLWTIPHGFFQSPHSHRHWTGPQFPADLSRPVATLLTAQGETPVQSRAQYLPLLEAFVIVNTLLNEVNHDWIALS